MKSSKEYVQAESKHGANNYKPLPIVISQAEGVWVSDPEGNRYMDMLSAYSSVNQGHRHPKIIAALKEQADKVTITSRAFYNDKLGEFYEKLVKLTNKEMILPMNTGAEAVETAIKAARRWGYQKKGVSNGKAEIIVAQDNFHGRTTTVISFSSDEEYKRDFGPFTPGFKIVPYGDINAIENAITPHTVAVLLEPIQGEAGIVIPPEGYLSEVSKLCLGNNILFIADEVQTGFGRTGKTFACDWEGVVPDIYIMGKALGGGVFPISAVAASNTILGVFEPGSHGSTFGGNPLACAVAIAAMQVVEDEKLAERSLELGQYFSNRLRNINSPAIEEIRSRGLFIGLVLNEPARPYCERLKESGVLCKETHENIIRFAPPLVITKDEIDWAMEKITAVFTK